MKSKEEDDSKPEIVEDSLDFFEHKLSLESLEDWIESQTKRENLETEVESLMEYTESIVASRYLHSLKRSSTVTSEPKVCDIKHFN